MALTKITPQMFDTSATAHDLNVDNGTFVVDGSASRVGIGTTTPSTLLDVNGVLTATSIAGTLTTAAQTNITSLGTLTGLTTSGSVGIKTTAASGVALDIRENSTTTAVDIRNANASGYGLYVAGGSSSSQYALRAADKDNNALFSVMGDGNVGIGTTSPGAVRLYSKTTASGNLAGLFENTHASASYGLKVQAGSSSSNYSFAIADRTNTTTHFYFRGDGNLGVGTTSPAAPLEIKNSANPLLILNQTNTSDNGALWFQHAGTTNGHIYVADDNTMYFSTVTTNPAVVIKSGGQVGIGTSTPQSYNSLAYDLVVGTTSGSRGITIVGATNGHSSLYFADGTSGTSQQLAGFVQYTHSTDALLFGTAATEAARILSNGNIVINKTNFSSLPTGSKLNIFGDGTTLRLDGSSATTKSILFRNVNAGNPGEIYADGSLRFRTEDASTRITFHTNSSGSNNERMRINTNGSITIGGGGSPRSVGWGDTKLQIEGTGATDSSISIIRNEAGNNPPYFVFAKSRSSSIGSNTIVQSGDDLGTIRWVGADGSDIANTAAQISAQVDGTPGTDDMPGRLLFYTTTDGSTSLTERMRISSNGYVGIGTGAVTPDSRLHIKDTNTDARGEIKFETGTGGNTGKIILMSTNNTDESAFIRKRSYYLELNAHDNEGLILGTNSTELLRLCGPNNSTTTYRNAAVIYGSGGCVPSNDNGKDLGSTSLRWRNIYTADLHLSNEGSKNDVDGTSGNWTIQEGETDLYIINNKSGKKYKFALEEID